MSTQLQIVLNATQSSISFSLFFFLSRSVYFSLQYQVLMHQISRPCHFLFCFSFSVNKIDMNLIFDVPLTKFQNITHLMIVFKIKQQKKIFCSLQLMLSTHNDDIRRHMEIQI